MAPPRLSIVDPDWKRSGRYPEPTAIQKTFAHAVIFSGLSVTELARRTGLSRSAVSEMLGGRTRGTIESWQKLLDAANATPDWYPSADNE